MQEDWRTAKWKGVLIRTMSDRWLNNIRKYFREGDGREKIKPVMDEIKRRRNKRNKHFKNIEKMNDECRKEYKEKQNKNYEQ